MSRLGLTVTARAEKPALGLPTANVRMEVAVDESNIARAFLSICGTKGFQLVRTAVWGPACTVVLGGSPETVTLTRFVLVLSWEMRRRQVR